VTYGTKHLFTTAMLGGAILIGSGAQAGPTVDIDFGTSLFPEGSDTLKFDFDDGSNSRTSWVRAGMLEGKATSAVDFNPVDLYFTEDQMFLYCVDIMTDLKTDKTTYDVKEVASDLVVGNGSAGAPRRDFGRMLEFLGAVNATLAGDTYNLSFGDANWLNPISNDVSGAIQVGIWESLYEADGVTLAHSSGDFSIPASLSSDGASFLTTVFNAMGSGSTSALSANQVRWFETDEGQDLLGYLNDPAPDLSDRQKIPEPATIALLMAGVGMLCFRSRRRSHLT
jgi:hypothetical protein